MDFLPQGFTKVLDKFGGSLEWLIGITVVLVLLIALVIIVKMWRSVANRKHSGLGMATGMQFQDIDALRKKGLIDEAEYKNIRRSLAKHETERASGEAEAERSRRLLQEVAINPDAALKFLTPEQLAAAAEREKNNTMQPALPPQQAPQPPQPAMNNPRVVQARNAARAEEIPPAQAPEPTAGPNPTSKPRDIDVLLAKGAITREEYDRLRNFFE